ncbi:cullin-4A [Trichonephila clavipes]|nr:cullin-4A [Trichonephila clavipes]
MTPNIIKKLFRKRSISINLDGTEDDCLFMDHSIGDGENEVEFDDVPHDMKDLPVTTDDVVSRMFIEFRALEQVVAIYPGMAAERAGVVSSQAKAAEGLGSNPGEDMDVCKCTVPLRHGGTLNRRRAASPLVWLGEERWEAPDHPQGFLPPNWSGTEQKRTVTWMVLRLTTDVNCSP